MKISCKTSIIDRVQICEKTLVLSIQFMGLDKHSSLLVPIWVDLFIFLAQVVLGIIFWVHIGSLLASNNTLMTKKFINERCKMMYMIVIDYNYLDYPYIMDNLLNYTLTNHFVNYFYKSFFLLV